jgi:hypothetical protein
VGTFAVEFQEQFKALRDGLQPTHVQALKVTTNGGDASGAVALLTCRKALKEAFTVYGDPLATFLTTTLPSWSAAQLQLQQQQQAPSSSQATPFTHRSPSETPVPSTCVSPTNHSSRLAGAGLFPPYSRRDSDHELSPSRSGAMASAASGHRKVDAATAKALKSVDGIRVVYARSIWGVLRLAHVRHQLNDELKTLESRCTILSKQCEQRVAETKMERQRLLLLLSSGNADDARLQKLNATLRLLSEIKDALVERFTEKLRRFTARRNVAIQQAEAALMRQLNKVVQAMHDASKHIHEFFGRFSTALLSRSTTAATPRHFVTGEDIVHPPAALALNGSLPADPPLPPPRQQQQHHHRSASPPPIPVSPRNRADDDDLDEDTGKQLRADYEMIRRENIQLKQMMEGLQFRQLHQSGGAAAEVDGGGGDNVCMTSPGASTKLKSPGSAARRRQSAVALAGHSSSDKASLATATAHSKPRGSLIAATAAPISGSRASGAPRRRSVLSTESSPAATPRDTGLFNHHNNSEREEMNSTSELPSMTEWAPSYAPFSTQQQQHGLLDSASSSCTPPPPPAITNQAQQQLQHHADIWSASFHAAVAQCTSDLPVVTDAFSSSTAPLTFSGAMLADKSVLTDAMVRWLSSSLAGLRQQMLSSAADDLGNSVALVRGGPAASIRRRPTTQIHEQQQVSDKNENTMPFLDQSQSCVGDEGLTKNPCWLGAAQVIDVAAPRVEAAVLYVSTRIDDDAERDIKSREVDRRWHGTDKVVQTDNAAEEQAAAFSGKRDAARSCATTNTTTETQTDTFLGVVVIPLITASVQTDSDVFTAASLPPYASCLDVHTQTCDSGGMPPLSDVTTLPSSTTAASTRFSDGPSPTSESKFARSRRLGGGPLHPSIQSGSVVLDVSVSPTVPLALLGNHAAITKRPHSANSLLGRGHPHSKSDNAADGCVQTEIELLVPLLMRYMLSAASPTEHPASTNIAAVYGEVALTSAVVDVTAAAAMAAAFQPRPSSALRGIKAPSAFVSSSSSGDGSMTTSTITMTSSAVAPAVTASSSASVGGGSVGVFRQRYAAQAKKTASHQPTRTSRK